LLIFVLLVVGVVLAVLSTHVQTGLSERRQYACNGRLPMPGSGYAYAWLGLAVGVVVAGLVIGLSVRAAGARRAHGVATGAGRTAALLAVCVVAILFEVFVLYTTYRAATPVPALCSG
jgi:hypothetical protein